MVTREDIVQSENDKAGEVLLNLSALQETCLNKETLLIKLLGLFIQQAPGWIEEIQGGADTFDPVRVRRICHTVKGATAALQATACVAILEELHVVSREGNLDNAHELVRKTVSTINKTKDLIKKILEIS